MVQRPLVATLSTLRTQRSAVWLQCRTFASRRESDPLRILFCGSDEFSIKSLRAVHELHMTEPQTIQSIDVVSRPPKKTGRGLKKVREVPIAHVARELSLPLHQINTFTGWQHPQFHISGESPINLIIAVSFGLLVPARLLQLSKYGGLNVHPSILPEFRGAAPLHHALLAGRHRTGVTLQTLHPRKMDHGQILLQTPQPGFDIPNSETITTPEFVEFIAPFGADMLIQGIRQRLYVPPINDLAPNLSNEETKVLEPAPKITPEDRHIKWGRWTVEEILRRQRVIGPLWSQHKSIGNSILRVVWSAGFEMCNKTISECEPGEGGFIEGDPHIYLNTSDGRVLRTRKIKVEGYGEHSASQIALKTGLVDQRRTETALLLNGFEATRFAQVVL